MLTKYITIKGENVFASKPYKDLKVCVDCTYDISLHTFHHNYHKSTYTSCRLKVATAFSQTRVIQGYLPTTQCQTASWSALGRLVKYISFKGNSSNDAAVCRDLLWMLSVNFRIFWNGHPSEHRAKMLILIRWLPTHEICNCAQVPQNSLQFAETKCGCRPWHVPSEDGAKMCFVVGNICFQQVTVATIMMI